MADPNERQLLAQAPHEARQDVGWGELVRTPTGRSANVTIC